MTNWKTLIVRATPLLTLGTLVVTAAASKKWA